MMNSCCIHWNAQTWSGTHIVWNNNRLNVCIWYTYLNFFWTFWKFWKLLKRKKKKKILNVVRHLRCIWKPHGMYSYSYSPRVYRAHCPSVHSTNVLRWFFVLFIWYNAIVLNEINYHEIRIYLDVCTLYLWLLLFPSIRTKWMQNFHHMKILCCLPECQTSIAVVEVI